MTLTRVHPVDRSASSHEIDDAALALLYSAPFDDWVRINLIASVDGSATGIDGTSNTLTNRTDRALLKLIRSASDVVVVGAATVRTEGYRLPSSTRLAIVTSTGDLRGHRLVANPAAAPLLVVCPEHAAAEVRESVGELPIDLIQLPHDGGRVHVADVVTALRARGLTKVLCEGGPNLVGQFVDSGLVDEICLTTAPILAGGRRVMAALDTTSAMRLTQLLVDEHSFQFARWALSARAREAARPTA